ncbi:MAG: primosomal protein N' [Opitutaceae bacterium]|nr:primosomal protein N' [Cytophagales bacterium]
MESIQFIDCYLPLALSGTFTYKLPIEFQDKLVQGSLVVVPFNERNIYTGIVKRVHSQPPVGYIVKNAIEILEQEPVFHPTQLKLLDWISEYYMAEPGLTFHAALPAGFKISTESKIQIHPAFEEDETTQLSENEGKLLDALKTVPALTYADALKVTRTKTLYHILQSLKKKQAILLFEEYKHIYKPRIIQKIRLAEKFIIDRELLKELMDSISGQEKQENVLLKYLQDVPVWNDKTINQSGIPKNVFNGNDFSGSALKTLIKKGVFEEFKEITSRENIVTEELKKDYQLSDIQEIALQRIRELFLQKDIVLLQGITGSGKTEIYISLVQEQIAAGKQVLFLMPEIALTTHMTSRLVKYFGKELDTYHSRLSENERVETWKKVQDGTSLLVLGARSSVFLPFKNLGLIIIDEEHDSSFKQNEKTPRYQARDTALVLAKLSGAKTLLGSATPSLESYYKAKSGIYGYVRLDTRHGQSLMPLIQFADLKADRKNTALPNPHMEYSTFLIKSLEESLEAKEQSLLFQNRRGYAPYLCCETCGWVSMCKQCAVSLTYHQRDKRLKCHYCGHQEKVSATCPACNSARLTTKGLGTEKIEEDLAALLPKARVQRMDQDTTRTKNAFKNIYDGLNKGEIDILVGTQMITKGLDFEKINLAGVLNADQMMYFPDFRANERAFQMLTQVAGRTGRREIQGKVIIQTFNPSHYLLQFLQQNDIDGFYEREIQEREKFHYPPFTRLIKLTFKDKDKNTCELSANFIAVKLRKLFGGARVLGPEWPPVDRINNMYLKEILLKFERDKIDIAKTKLLLKNAISEFHKDKTYKSTILVLDVDPY